ncbi:MAG TPA: SIMPL domain-containing protein [Rhizomicrobium sp.]|jgi:hypothetical protein
MRLSRGLIGIALAGFALAAQQGFAQEAGAPGAIPRTITVTGEGEAKAAPDQAQLSAGVVTTARKAADALAANTQAMNQVFAALNRLGIPDKSIQTSGFSVEPQYAGDRNGNPAQRITGYQVSNEVMVTVDDMGRLGAALDALVASGANSLGNMSFTIRDPKPLLAEARAAAMKDAIARAQTYATAAGLSLGPVLAVSEGGTEMPRSFAPMAMKMAAAAVPIASGENSLSASVSVTFEIR